MATELSVTTEKTEKFFNDLESQKSNLSRCVDLFKTLTTHITSLQQAVFQRTQSVDSKFQSLDAHFTETLASLVDREDSINERESSMMAGVEEKKMAALLEFESTQKQKTLCVSLKSLCRRMDSFRLLKFLLSKRRDASALRLDLPSALVEAIDPGRLVLDVVDEVLSSRNDKNAITDKRWGCLILVQALFPLEGNGKGTQFARSVEERAAGILDRWKSEGGIVGAVEAVIFLQIMVGFRLQDRFDAEFVKMLVMENASRREMAQIAAEINFGENMGGIIDEMVKAGNEIEAVYFSCKTGMTERYPPVSLLKSYIKNSKKTTDAILKKGNHGSAAMEESDQVELNSLKAVIKCVEDNKLESLFPLENLKKRAHKLEETKAEKKKRSASSAGKPQNKRARGSTSKRDNGSTASRSEKAPKFPKGYSSFGQVNIVPTVPPSPVARYAAPYMHSSNHAYESHLPSLYASTYRVTPTQSPGSISQQQYTLPANNASGGFPTGSSYPSHTTYGAYEYGSAGAPAYQL